LTLFSSFVGLSLAALCGYKFIQGLRNKFTLNEPKQLEKLQAIPESLFTLEPVKDLKDLQQESENTEKTS
jgi:hypothetical protein